MNKDNVPIRDVFKYIDPELDIPCDVNNSWLEEDRCGELAEFEVQSTRTGRGLMKLYFCLDCAQSYLDWIASVHGELSYRDQVLSIPQQGR